MDRTEKKLLLIGWDSADWKVIRPLVARGEMPVLAKLLRTGVSGNLATLEPILSPMLWTSIATGKRPYQHGVHGFTEVDPATERVVPVSAATRQCRALWEMLADHGLHSNVVGWFATHGERNPRVNLVSNLYAHSERRRIGAPAEWPPSQPGTYWPEELAAQLEEFRLHPTEIDRDLLHLFVPRAPEIDQRKDPRLYHLAEKLAETISMQAAATWLMEHKPWNLTAVYFRAIDEISHDFMPYHAPRMAGVRQEDFDLYHDVVNSAYRFHDLFLANLIARAGADTAVVLVSDHGFHSDHLRPAFTPNVPAGIVVWHRPQGIFAASGPGFAVGEEIQGAGLLDVTPTILRWFDLPRGADMAGRVLNEAFAERPPKKEIPSWEQTAPAAAPAVTRPRLSAADNDALLQQFVALGYIGELPAEPAAAAEATRRENAWQLAQSYMHGGRPEEALPLFEDVFTAHPERVDFAQRLAQCQLQLGLLDEADATIDAALASFSDTASTHLIRANIAFQRGDFAGSLRHLEIVRASDPDSVAVLEQLARTYLKLRRWDECEATARRVLTLDPEHALAWVGISRCQLHRGESAAAMESALRAVALNYNNPVAHGHLGVALGQLKRWEEAAHALRNATILQPHFVLPYRFLAQALKQLGRQQEAEELMTRARSMRQMYDFQRQQQLARRRDHMAQRAVERRARRQQQREAAARLAAETAPTKSLELVIVSGLPRSGTSLMMQMLAAGGLPPLTDGLRTADESNSEGYYEWEPLKQIDKNPRLIEQADGKAVKVISALVPSLPTAHRYKIIFMRRPVTEVVQSQHRMLTRMHRAPTIEEVHLQRTQAEHTARTLELLSRAAQVQLLVVDYPNLVAAPVEGAQRVLEFLGQRHLPHATAAAMAATVKPALYRQRTPS